MTCRCRRQSSGVMLTITPVKPSSFILDRVKVKASPDNGPDNRAVFKKAGDDGAMEIWGFSASVGAERCLVTHCMCCCGAESGRRDANKVNFN